MDEITLTSQRYVKGLSRSVCSTNRACNHRCDSGDTIALLNLLNNKVNKNLVQGGCPSCSQGFCLCCIFLASESIVDNRGTGDNKDCPHLPNLLSSTSKQPSIEKCGTYLKLDAFF